MSMVAAEDACQFNDRVGPMLRLASVKPPVSKRASVLQVHAPLRQLSAHG